MNNESLKINIIQPFPALTKAIKNILYPLVSLLIRTGIHFPQIAELLKEVYIDVANNEFSLEGKKQTQTRLSFITGVHRKDVKRLQDARNTSKGSSKNEPENVNLGVKLISKWLNESRFQDEYGEPLLLPLKSESEPSFDELVETMYKQNIRSRVILDEWISLGIVKLHEKKVQLISDAYIPKESLNQKAFFLGHNIADHLSAASINLLSESPPFFERCIYYDDLSSDSISELNKLINDDGMVLLKKINKKAAELKQQDLQRTCSKKRITIGLYLYHQKEQINTNKNQQKD